MTKKEVEYLVFECDPKDVKDKLYRSVITYLAFYQSVKVGITGRDPQERFDEHLTGRQWNRMVIKYVHTSEKIINELEDHLITKFPELKNDWKGYSDLSKKGPNYLYFLLYRLKLPKPKK